MKITTLSRLVFLSLLGVGGCTAQPVVSYDTHFTSAIDFGKSLVSEMQTGADKQLSKLFNKERTDGDINILSAKFFPRSGTAGVMASFNNYCIGINGTFRGGLCHDGAELSAYFFVALRPTGTVVGGTDEIVMEVFESNLGSSVNVIKAAQTRGFATQMESLLAEQATQARQRRQTEQLEAELSKRRQISIQTRELVLQKGTQICPVDINDPVCNKFKCYTEDSNGTTNRVKVSALGNIRWEDASMWYACQ